MITIAYIVIAVLVDGIVAYHMIQKEARWGLDREDIALNCVIATIVGALWPVAIAIHIPYLGVKGFMGLKRRLTTGKGTV